MAWGSSAPAAIAALVAQLDAGMETKVIDSAVVSDASTKEVVNIAWQTEDQPGVEMQLDPYASAADIETVTINNAIRVLTARDGIAARSRAFGLLREVGTLIKDDRTLGDTVMRAWISSATTDSQQGRPGALATILFAVTYTAETTD